MRSNCFLEAIKAKIRSPFDVEIHKKRSFRLWKDWPHFYWYYKPHDKCYCFWPDSDEPMTWAQEILYEGSIVMYERDRWVHI